VTDVAELDHVVIRVSDVARTREFYARVLGAEPVDLSYGRLGLRFGDRQINVHGPGSTPTPVAERKAEPGSFDLCFRWRRSPAESIEHLRGHGVEPELGPVPRTGARGDGESVYFRDPDGNLLELISY
jgi:catechol 2,3-dioxygenase-like lactoylglutathione lyase family enzyme